MRSWRKHASGAYLVAVVDPSATRRLGAPAGMCSCEAAKHGQACSHIICARWMFDRLHEDATHPST